MTRPLNRLIAAYRARAGAGTHSLPSSLATLAAGVDGPVVLLLDDHDRDHDEAAVAEWLRAFGVARVHVLAAPGRRPVAGVRWVEVSGRREVDRELTLIGTCAVIVDEVASDPGKQLQRWTRFGLHLRPGGWYAVRARSTPDQWRVAVASLGDQTEQFVRAELEASAALVQLAAGHLLLPKRRRHVLRVGELTLDRVLERRTPDLKVSTIASRPAAHVTSDVKVVSHGQGPSMPPTSFEAQPLTCRWYRGAVEVRWHLLTLHGDTMLPPSFRHAWAGRLRNPELIQGGGPYPELRPVQPLTDLEGDYFDLNAAVGGHFGHVMTESIGKLWAWEQARAEIPGIKGFYRLPKGADRPTFETGIFAAFGLSADDMYWATSDVRIESYVSPTIPWHNSTPFHFHPVVEEVWKKLRAALVIHGQRTPERIFVSRGPGDRQCRNQAEVEAWFADRGFAVVYPERLSLPDQATLFANARVVAGFAGSALFNLLFSEHVDRVILLTHGQYTARNEWLFGLKVADELHYFWSEPETRAAPGVRWSASFHSPWSFDFERFGAELAEAVK